MFYQKENLHLSFNFFVFGLNNYDSRDILFLIFARFSPWILDEQYFLRRFCMFLHSKDACCVKKSGEVHKISLLLTFIFSRCLSYVLFLCIRLTYMLCIVLVIAKNVNKNNNFHNLFMSFVKNSVTYVLSSLASILFQCMFHYYLFFFVCHLFVPRIRLTAFFLTLPLSDYSQLSCDYQLLCLKPDQGSRWIDESEKDTCNKKISCHVWSSLQLKLLCGP